MMVQIMLTLLLMGGFLGILLIGEYMHKRYDLPVELVRKLTHVTSTLTSLVIIFIIDSHWYMLGLGLFFFILLFIAQRRGMFRSVHGVKRKSGGSYLLPIGVYLCFLVSDVLDESIYFVLPILILGISDALAGAIGIVFYHKTSNIRLFGRSLEKTYLGSMAFFVSSFLICVFVFYFYGHPVSHTLFWAMVIGFFTAFAEMLSNRGIDNVTIPIVALLILLFV